MVEIVDFTPIYAQAFHDINRSWLQELGFSLEPIDVEVLGDPQRHLLDSGGHIKIALLNSQPVGVGALKKTGPHRYELTKVGVLAQARGHRIGALLLEALVEKAKEVEAQDLYLLTSQRCVAAIQLYEKTGWLHDQNVMEQFGAGYSRCDVAMRYSGLPEPAPN